LSDLKVKALEIVLGSGRKERLLDEPTLTQIIDPMLVCFWKNVIIDNHNDIGTTFLENDWYVNPLVKCYSCTGFAYQKDCYQKDIEGDCYEQDL